MLLAMKIKIAITLAALASPVAFTVAPVNHGTVDAGFAGIKFEQPVYKTEFRAVREQGEGGLKLSFVHAVTCRAAARL